MRKEKPNEQISDDLSFQDILNGLGKRLKKGCSQPPLS